MPANPGTEVRDQRFPSKLRIESPPKYTVPSALWAAEYVLESVPISSVEYDETIGKPYLPPGPGGGAPKAAAANSNPTTHHALFALRNTGIEIRENPADGDLF